MKERAKKWDDRHRAHYLYSADGKFGGIILSHPWREFSKGMKECVRLMVRTATRGER